MNEIANGLLYYAVFLFSTTLHEAGHAWAAMRGGDLTAYHGGQVSLDPMPHIRREPFGMVVLPLLTALTTGWAFGYASAPYDRHWAVRHPRRAALMSLAGPAANLLLVLVAAMLLRTGAAMGKFQPPDRIQFGFLADSNAGGAWPTLGIVLSVVFSLNLLLCLFNLLPLPPLDGSMAITLLMSPGRTARYQQFLWSNPMLGLAGMFVAWKVFDPLFMPVFTLAASWLYPGVTYG